MAARRSGVLAEYSRKRDFKKTPEPGPGKGGARGKDGPIFVVQKHDASRLHYDFRLEVNGALASWAVPKGPSLDPDDKRLAVHVEDHPLDYAGFEGVIPHGEYGGGEVIVWDRGVWRSDEDDPAGAIRKGKLSFTLEGERLRGAWTLARMRGRGEDDNDNWLLIKHEDEFAERGGPSIVERLPESVATSRTVEGLAREHGTPHARRNMRRRSKAAPGKPAQPGGEAVDASGLEGATRGAKPPRVKPQLCTLVDEAPRGEGWVHEIKFDGYRLMAVKRGASVELITRAGHDWTAKFGPIRDAVTGLACEACVLDGEAVIVDEKGRTSFQDLQSAIKAQRFERLAFYVFDLLYLDGVDLRRASLLDRKGVLKRVVGAAGGGVVVRYSEHVRGAGPDTLRSACDLALEGVVSKRADAQYTPGRSKTWVKSKCSKRQEFVVVGWTAPGGSRKHFGSLLLGAHDANGRLVYTGRVGTGFDASTLRDLGGRLKALARKTCPADEPPTREEQRGARWVEPRIVVEVEFTEWTGDGRLRHPSFQGVREDKEANEVKVEREKPVERVEAATTTPPSRPAGRRTWGAGKKDDAVAVAGVALSNPDRVLYPEQGLTKRGLAEYYEAVAEWIMPHLVGRPISAVRCPQGRGAQCFFQKHVRESFGEAVRPIKVEESDEEIAEYIAVDSLPGVIELVQFGVLEMHPWGATERDLDKPDLLTFDLDPGEGVELDAIKDSARQLRGLFKDLGLESFVKASGGKGLHVVVPLTPDAAWDEAKAFCAAIAKGLAREQPDRYVAKSAKAARKGKIFIDYLRNSRGATSIAPYSTRARAGAPVAAPLRWEELGRLESPAQFTVETMPRRLSRLKSDPWEGFFEVEQRLPATGE